MDRREATGGWRRTADGGETERFATTNLVDSRDWADDAQRRGGIPERCGNTDGGGGGVKADEDEGGGGTRAEDGGDAEGSDGEEGSSRMCSGEEGASRRGARWGRIQYRQYESYVYYRNTTGIR